MFGFLDILCKALYNIYDVLLAKYLTKLHFGSLVLTFSRTFCYTILGGYFMNHPFLNCENCDPHVRKACNYPNNGICAREVKLPPDVCPMFPDIPIDECPEIDYHTAGIIVKTVPP